MYALFGANLAESKKYNFFGYILIFLIGGSLAFNLIVGILGSFFNLRDNVCKKKENKIVP